jgi:hypothetical protein
MSGPTVCSTYLQGKSKAGVTTVLPVGQPDGYCCKHAASSRRPAARWIAPHMPPPAVETKNTHTCITLTPFKLSPGKRFPLDFGGSQSTVILTKIKTVRTPKTTVGGIDDGVDPQCRYIALPQTHTLIGHGGHCVSRCSSPISRVTAARHLSGPTHGICPSSR